MVSFLALRRPGLREYLYSLLFLIFAVFNIYVLVDSLTVTATGQPFFEYYSDSGIKIITLLSSVVDLIFIFLALAFMRRERQWPIFALFGVLVTGVILPWIELWYGSTFYYGEVRTLQGLPFMIANGGLLGSFLYLTYGISRLQFSGVTCPRIIFFRKTALMIAGLFIETVLYFLLQDTWMMWFNISG